MAAEALAPEAEARRSGWAQVTAQATAQVHRAEAGSSAGQRISPMFYLPALVGLAVAVYFVARPAGRWAENDTAALAAAIRGVLQYQRVVPPPDVTALYQHGYGYQVLAAMLVSQTGLSVTQFQQVLSPLLFGLLLLPVAWCTYRELLRSEVAATLATVFLVIQPEVLFIALRGSHEKITRTLLLLTLWLLARSLPRAERPGAFALHLVLLYAAAYGILASNNLFGSSFFAALAAALALGWLLVQVRVLAVPVALGRLNTRLLFSAVTLFALSVVFTFYVYPPAAEQMWLYHDIWERVAALLLRVERPISPYAVVVIGWVSVPVYLVLSVANWLLLGVSALFWILQGWGWFFVPILRVPGQRIAAYASRWRSAQPPAPQALLVWLLYGAFAMQELAAVVVDFTGAVAGNFQHRAFASLSMVAVAIIAGEVAPWLAGRPRVRTWRTAAVGVGCGLLALLAAAKATNEPLLSNKWMFYEAQELQALRWAQDNLRGAVIWTDFDERLTAAYQLAIGANAEPASAQLVQPAEVVPNVLDGFTPEPGTRDFLVTDVTRYRAERLGVELPVGAGELQTYDNGAAQLKHLVPRTPYQR